MYKPLFVADIPNNRYTIKNNGDWLVLKPCTITVDPQFFPKNNGITINIASDNVALCGTWLQLSSICIEYGSYRPPALVLEDDVA